MTPKEELNQLLSKVQTRKMHFLVTIEVDEEEFDRLCGQYLIREVKKVGVRA